MKELGEHGSLTERFTSVIAEDVAFAQIQAARARKEIDDIQHGQKSGSDANSRLTSAAASKEMQGAAQDKAEKEAKEREEDALFLALLNNGDLDNYVAENIFGGMSDFEIADVVSAIEAETGLSFEDYAENILGDDMPERVPGESDSDYHRRVLTAVADEILEDDLSIKAGYENDPLARFVNNHEFTQHARELTREADVIALRDGADAAIAHVTTDVQNSYAVSAVVESDSAIEELSRFGRETQDQHWDEETEKLTTIERTSSFFSGFPGSAGALERAKVDLENQFPNAAAPPNQTADTSVETNLTVDLGRDLT